MPPHFSTQHNTMRFDPSTALLLLGEELIGPAGFSSVQFTPSITLEIDLADPSLRLWTIDVDATTSSDAAVIGRLFGTAVANKLSDEFKTIDRFDIPSASVDSAIEDRVGRVALINWSEDWQQLADGALSPWWHIERVTEMASYDRQTAVREAGDYALDFVTRLVMPTSPEARRLLRAFADLAQSDSPGAAGSLRAFATPDGGHERLPKATRDIALLDRWSKATDFQSIDSHRFEVVIDPLSAPVGLAMDGNPCLVERKGDIWNLDVAASPIVASRGPHWARIYDPNNRSLVALVELNRQEDRLIGSFTLRRSIRGLALDFPSDVERRPPSRGERAAWFASSSGACAGQAERIRDADAAAALWQISARAWLDAGDQERSAIASAYSGKNKRDAEPGIDSSSTPVDEYHGWAWRRLAHHRTIPWPLAGDVERHSS